ELASHYATARRMLGAVPNPRLGYVDEIIRDVGRDLGKEASFRPTDVAVYFGEPGKTVPDPFFGGAGPARTGCIACGACMPGCRLGAKNTLDKNYLYLAERLGLEVETETEVTAVRPATEGGYRIEALAGLSPGRREARTFSAKNVIFAGGVMGTVELLLRLK